MTSMTQPRAMSALIVMSMAWSVSACSTAARQPDEAILDQARDLAARGVDAIDPISIPRIEALSSTRCDFRGSVGECWQDYLGEPHYVTRSQFRVHLECVEEGGASGWSAFPRDKSRFTRAVDQVAAAVRDRYTQIHAVRARSLAEFIRKERPIIRCASDDAPGATESGRAVLVLKEPAAYEGGGSHNMEHLLRVAVMSELLRAKGDLAGLPSDKRGLAECRAHDPVSACAWMTFPADDGAWLASRDACEICVAADRIDRVCVPRGRDIEGLRLQESSSTSIEDCLD